MSVCQSCGENTNLEILKWKIAFLGKGKCKSCNQYFKFICPWWYSWLNAGISLILSIAILGNLSIPFLNSIFPMLINLIGSDENFKIKTIIVYFIVICCFVIGGTLGAVTSYIIQKKMRFQLVAL